MRVEPWMLTMALSCFAAFLIGYIVAWFLDELKNK